MNEKTKIEDWRDRGACREADPGLFFNPEGDRSGSRRRKREAAAKLVCMTCEVRLNCLESALDKREPHGVWGGLSESELDRVYNNTASAPNVIESPLLVEARQIQAQSEQNTPDPLITDEN